MQASASTAEADGGNWQRRDYEPHNPLVNDPSHYATETISYMHRDHFDNGRDLKRLSFVPSAGESISTIPPHLAGSESPTSLQPIQVLNTLKETSDQKLSNSRQPLNDASSIGRGSSLVSSSSSRTLANTVAVSSPVNNIGYESDPMEITQELNNLAAIRRMSMGMAAAGDPDLPSFVPDADMPLVAPSPSADENDTSQLFWVPARLHPELAPREFKSFLESKADHIKRTSGDYSSLISERTGSAGSLHRKKSTLSRQIEDSSEFTDGAERLERKRSEAQARNPPRLSLHQLKSAEDDSSQESEDSSPSVTNGVQKLMLMADEDKPILPVRPLGASLRRSTRTQYKRGSIKKGGKVPYSRRVVRMQSKSNSLPPSVNSPESQSTLDLTNEPTRPSLDTNQTARDANAHSGNIAFDFVLDPPAPERESTESVTTGTKSNANTSSQAQKWHSSISSNGRSTVNIPPSEQKLSETAGGAPGETRRIGQLGSTLYHKSEQDTRQPPTLKTSEQVKKPTNNGINHSRRTGKDGSVSLDEFASNPQRLPGNTTRTDSLSFIPTAMEDYRKPESKKIKDKKETEGSRKSSWHWFLSTEDKEKEKDKDKKKEREGDLKKIKTKLVDKTHDAARRDILQPTVDNQKGRESYGSDLSDTKLEEERKKDNARRTANEKKEKEPGLFLSIFGGGKKKNSGGSYHKKNISKHLSPTPPARLLEPDIDYPWTRFTILEERAIYRMAHIKLANPRRALYSQVLLSNFMYSYLAKIQQMQPQMIVAPEQQKSREQHDEYLQYQRYQQTQEQQYNDNSYDDHRIYEYADDAHGRYQPQGKDDKYNHDNGDLYRPEHYQYGYPAYGGGSELDNEDDNMW